jgi:hypothetical protein
MTATRAETKEHWDARSGMRVFDRIVLGVTVFLWLTVFLLGTLVNSAPYRERFAGLDGAFFGIVGDGVVVALTYTLSNVGLLCLLASLLGSIGASANLGVDADAAAEQDTSAPRTSAILRGFLVYLSLLAGVLMFAETPAAPSQTQYVRLAGVTSLVSFAVNYRPALFATLFTRLSKLFEK